MWGRQPHKRRLTRMRQTMPSNRLLISILLAVLIIWVTYVRLPPRITLLNNPETKKILVELKKWKRIQAEISAKHTKNAPHRVIRIREDSEDYDSSVEDDEQEASISAETRNGALENDEKDEAGFEDNDERGDENADQLKSTPTTLSKYDIDPADTQRKYFVFQPSGGWGNQRMILRWAMRVANAMGRTLIVPMVAPHNKMWYGYDRLNASEMIPADRVLDMDALEAGTVEGVRVYRDHLSKLPSVLRGTWKRNSKRSTMWLTENAIKSKWRGLSHQVIFWNRGSMWECCAGGTMMTPYVMFSRELKQFSLDLAEAYFKGRRYNAVHVRRGGGHTRLDRRTAQHYLEMKIEPAGFDKGLAIYIATDERNKTWFEYWREQGYTYLFWNDLAEVNPKGVSRFLSAFPQRTHNDVIGFVEQLICGRAAKWTGSDGSTFSYSIEGMRNFPSLTEVDWQSNMDSTVKSIYAHDGRGVQTPSREAEAEKKMEAHNPTETEEDPDEADEVKHDDREMDMDTSA